MTQQQYDKAKELQDEIYQLEVLKDAVQAINGNIPYAGGSDSRFQPVELKYLLQYLSENTTTGEVNKKITERQYKLWKEFESL